MAGKQFTAVIASGSLASTVALAREAISGKPETLLEVWHPCLDAAHPSFFLEWPVTDAYLEEVAAEFELPVCFLKRYVSIPATSQERSGRIRDRFIWEMPNGSLQEAGLERCGGEPVNIGGKHCWVREKLKQKTVEGLIRQRLDLRDKQVRLVDGDGELDATSLKKTCSSYTAKLSVDKSTGAKTEQELLSLFRETNLRPHPAWRAHLGYGGCLLCSVRTPAANSLATVLPEWAKRTQAWRSSSQVEEKLITRRHLIEQTLSFRAPDVRWDAVCSVVNCARPTEEQTPRSGPEGNRTRTSF